MANQTPHTTPACKDFYDIYDSSGDKKEGHPEPKLTDEERAALKDKNDRNEKLYRAVAEILKEDFKIVLPPDPKQFPGSLKGEALAQAVAILGIIQADNWQDPANGKTSPNSEDRPIGKHDVIDRRFIDAVVDAVKEYTSSSHLYNRVFELMLAEAAQGVQAQPTTT